MGQPLAEAADHRRCGVPVRCLSTAELVGEYRVDAARVVDEDGTFKAYRGTPHAVRSDGLQLRHHSGEIRAPIDAVDRTQSDAETADGDEAATGPCDRGQSRGIEYVGRRGSERPCDAVGRAGDHARGDREFAGVTDGDEPAAVPCDAQQRGTVAPWCELRAPPRMAIR